MLCLLPGAMLFGIWAGAAPGEHGGLEAGTRHHASKALAERIAGGLGVVGGALMSRRCCCSASAARVACGGIAGRQGFEIALSSGDTIPTCWGEFRGNQEEQGEKRHCGFWPSGRHARTHGVERLRPRENGQRLGGGEWGETD